MTTLSFDFANENNYNNALQILKPKNFDDFLMNITIQVPENSINDILFTLEYNNINYNVKIY